MGRVIAPEILKCFAEEPLVNRIEVYAREDLLDCGKNQKIPGRVGQPQTYDTAFLIIGKTWAKSHIRVTRPRKPGPITMAETWDLMFGTSKITPAGQRAKVPKY